MKIRFWNIWKSLVLLPHSREPFYISKIKDFDPSTIRNIEMKLVMLGFQPNYFSYGCINQLTSMRRLYIKDDEWRQYHIRIYRNGEIFGHDELSYEYCGFQHLQARFKKIPEDEINKVLKILGV